MSCCRSILTFIDRLASTNSSTLGACFALLARQFPKIILLRRRKWPTPILLGLCVIALATSGCSQGILAPVGPVADGERLILLDALGIMLLIAVPTILATLWFAWWFRASNQAALYRPTWAYSDKLEVIVWAIPALVVLFLGGVAWIGSHQLDPARPIESSERPLEVQVVSLDWRWLFIYPEQHIATVNRLVVPVGTPVHFRITSSSVMNVFFVPRIGGEIYAMNGMVTQLNLLARNVGRFPGLSAQFSGDGFSDMEFNTDVVSEKGFHDFVVSAGASSNRLDAAEYVSLSRQSTSAEVKLFGTVASGIFDDIVSRRLPPGSGPGPTAQAILSQKGM
jgi:cytochrome o ubiquinol oxidase subunit 2